MVLSHQQQEIIEIDFSSRLTPENTIVDSKAGCAKTSTAVLQCANNPTLNILILAFSSDVAKEVAFKTKHLKNVEVSTIHSLAYKVFGKQFSTRRGDLKISDICKYVEVYNNEDAVWEFEEASIALRLYNYFLTSHLSIEDAVLELINKDRTVEERIFNIGKGEKYFIDIVSKIWDDVICENSSMPASDNVYLKLFFLSNPNLNKDLILVDEAQDVNKVMMFLVLNQKAKKVWYGDKDQNIFSFNDTINALDYVGKFYDCQKMYLTKSFRCPQSVVDIANKYLQILGNDKESFVGIDDKEIKTNTTKQETVIARGIGTLFSFVKEKLKTEDIKIHLLGGIKKWELGDIYDILKLFSRAKGKKVEIHNEFIDSFPDFKSLLEYAKSSNEVNLLSKVNLVRNNIAKKEDELSIYQLLQEIRDRHVKVEEADYILCSAHRAKGLEWDNVRLLNDFIRVDKKVFNNEFICSEEVRLLYVAITRCKSVLHIDDNYLIDNKIIEASKKLLI